MAETHKRQIDFEAIQNFRDIGGYRTAQGKSVVWRRIFRSGNLRQMTPGDLRKLKEEIRLTTVIDLRSDFEIKRQGMGLLAQADFIYHNIAFITDGGSREADERRFKACSNMGQFYLDIVRDKGYGRRIIAALEVIAAAENHPLVFHCAVGKDRTGILASLLLSLLGVNDNDIIKDYTQSTTYMEELLKHLNEDPKMAEGAKGLPDYFWKASEESMVLFLTTLRKEYGSIAGYLEFMGSESLLKERLERALLT